MRTIRDPRLSLLARVAFPVVLLALLRAGGQAAAADLAISTVKFGVAGPAVPVYSPVDPCREAVTLHGTLDVLALVSLDPTTGALKTVRLYANLANAIGTGPQRTYHATGSVKASPVCARTDPCYVPYQSEFDLIPTTAACAATTVLVTGGLFFRPDGVIADGSRPGDPTCTSNDPVGITCSGFTFAPVP